MLFTVLISIFIITLSFMADNIISIIIMEMEAAFESHFVNQVSIMLNADPKRTEQYCENSIHQFSSFYEIYSILYVIILFSGIGYLTAIIQKLTVVRLKDNVKLPIFHMLLEICIVCIPGSY